MANRRSTPSRPSSLPETTRVTGTGRDVVVEILDDSDTPLDETGQETGTAKLPVAKQVHTQMSSHISLICHILVYHRHPIS